MVLFEHLQTVEARRRPAAADDPFDGARDIRSGRSGARGFTLIELMFASVFLATGLLAIAAMEDIAISQSNSAKRMSVSTNMVSEMLERIRYNTPANVTAPYPYSFQITCVTSAITGATTCPAGSGNVAPTTTNATALGDYNQWRARLMAPDTSGHILLPNVTVTVTSTAVDVVNNTSGATGADGLADMGQVLVTVTLSYSSGVRTPIVAMSTIVTPL